MGRLFLVEFDQSNPEVNFYCCRICRAHIALSQDCDGWAADVRAAFFSKVVNVISDDNSLYEVDDYHCVRCNKLLGWGFIQQMLPVFGSKFLLKMELLLFWNGALLRNAHELLPAVED